MFCPLQMHWRAQPPPFQRRMVVVLKCCPNVASFIQHGIKTDVIKRQRKEVNTQTEGHPSTVTMLEVMDPKKGCLSRPTLNC